MAKPYSFKGVITEINDTQTFSSGFTKREVVVTDNGGKYPNDVKFTFKKDNVSLVDSLMKGLTVTVDFFLDGRRGETAKGVAFFIDLNAVAVTVDKIEAKDVCDFDAYFAFCAQFGETRDQAIERGKAYAKKVGKPSNTYTLADWTALTAEVVAAHGGAADDAAAAQEDMPF